MATYKPNKDGYYKKTLTLGRKPDGRPDIVVIRSKSYQEFKQKVREAENRRDHGYDFDAKDMTVAEWAAKWIDTYKKSKIQDSSVTTYDVDIRLHINPVIGAYKIDDVKPYELQQLLNAHVGRSKSHVQKLRMCIKQIFKRAYVEGIILKDVSEGLELPECTEGERRPLTDEERCAFEQVAKTHRAGLWILSMLDAGLRPEESCGLMWNDIDLTEGKESITVRRAVQWEHNQPKIKKPKKREKSTGKEAERTIPIPPQLSEKFRDAKQTSRSLYVFPAAERDGLMTLTAKNRLWKSFQRAVDIHMGAKTYRNAITEHALDQEITPYYLRHTCCTHWFEIGLDLKTVQYLMGHKDIQTTANIYTHFMGRSVDKAGEIIRKKFSAGQTVDKKQTSI